jgi:hypothetical protein
MTSFGPIVEVGAIRWSALGRIELRQTHKGLVAEIASEGLTAPTRKLMVTQ